MYISILIRDYIGIFYLDYIGMVYGLYIWITRGFYRDYIVSFERATRLHARSCYHTSCNCDMGPSLEVLIIRFLGTTIKCLYRDRKWTYVHPDLSSLQKPGTRHEETGTCTILAKTISKQALNSGRLAYTLYIIAYTI